MFRVSFQAMTVRLFKLGIVQPDGYVRGAPLVGMSLSGGGDDKRELTDRSERRHKGCKARARLGGPYGHIDWLPPAIEFR